ncbi:hypothetical protein MG293_017402 [Ovis ammon polii]|uniref:Nuclease EXOG, mitochondrial n=1 Tax=Ovis ammon polii TaxID=230172 RepID=A0AAD4Y2S8_OVIAM|nr:hypothetical protein MG293_017402 [Ovis ammon polii]
MRVWTPWLRLALKRPTWSVRALRQKASVSGKMAAKSFASRLRGSRRFLSGFVAGAVAGAASTGLVVVQFLRSRDAEPAAVAREPDVLFSTVYTAQYLVHNGRLKAMAETFYLSNIVPQNFDNNAGYWNRIEMYCRELTERFEDVWIVSGPLTLPQTGSDGKKTVSYQVIGEDNVAVPSHLYKVILARRSAGSAEPLALGAFVVPNKAIGFQPQLSEFQVSLQDLEKLSGLVFFPHLDRTSDIRNICSVDTCKLLDFREFTLYLSTRKVEGARSVVRLEKVMENLRNAGIEPDEYFMTRYEKKLEELRAREQSGVLEEKPS